MKEKYLSPQRMFHISSSCYCGVVVPEEIMKKAQKILLKAEADLKNLLLQNISECVPYSWDLASVKNDDKILEQETIHHSNYHTWSTSEDRIKSLKLAEPKLVYPFYLIKNEEQLNEIKGSVLEELIQNMEKEKEDER